MLTCYLLADYWGLVHVRTMQSRYTFPRAVVLLHCGCVVYLTWWPLAPEWLAVTATALVQLSITLVLSHRFDCFANLPVQPPLRLLCRSLLLPAAPMGRDPPPPRPAKGLKVPHPLREEFSSLVPPRRVPSQPGRPPRNFSPRPARAPGSPVRAQSHSPVQGHVSPAAQVIPPSSPSAAATAATREEATSSSTQTRDSGSNTVEATDAGEGSADQAQRQNVSCQAGPAQRPALRTTACQTTGGLLDGLGPFDNIPDHVVDGS